MFRSCAHDCSTSRNFQGQCLDPKEQSRQVVNLVGYFGDRVHGLPEKINGLLDKNSVLRLRQSHRSTATVLPAPEPRHHGTARKKRPRTRVQSCYISADSKTLMSKICLFARRVEPNPTGRWIPTWLGSGVLAASLSALFRFRVRRPLSAPRMQQLELRMDNDQEVVASGAFELIDGFGCPGSRPAKDKDRAM